MSRFGGHKASLGSKPQRTSQSHVTKLVRHSNTENSLNANYDWKEVESRVRRFYRESDTRGQLGRKLARKKPVGYVEGPPTLNVQPHVGHVRGRIYKDLWYRYSTMSGENIVFRGGWDTQGLPIELQAEKELGLTGNKWENLRQVGVERLVEECKALIGRVRKEWEKADDLIGLMLDQERAYMTYRDSYIEREWAYLRTAWKRGLLGEGFKVVAYCPSCQTSLSSAEVSLGGYEQLEDPSLYYKVKASDGSYLVIWTTMPFTVVTDEMVAVKPDADYEYVVAGNETWVVCADRKDSLERELGISFGETVKRVKGKELEGLRYTHPLLAEIPGLAKLGQTGKVHVVVAEEFVDTTTATGLVHLSPANGEDDFAAAQRRGVPVFVPLDDQVKFTQEAGKYNGLFARDADAVVVDDLRRTGALVHADKLTHDYPVCWRSGHRIVWLSRREYFYWIDRLRDQLVEAAQKVEYYNESPKNRFLEFIRESPPWGITRERIWGTPLPIWVCRDCGEKVGAFSRRQILEMASELPDGRDFELHRPWVDRVVLRCPKCGGSAYREPFVLDTWHNSGSAPYSSFTDAEYRSLVPVAFLTEGIDQTRGWAYTLLALNVILTGKAQAPYRAFLFQGHVLDEQGRKMSKSLGNVVWGLKLLRGSSVDVSRFYLTWKAAPVDPLALDEEEMKGRPFQVMNTLYHLHVYLSQNGRMDGYDPLTHTLSWTRRRRLLTLVDRWMIAKLATSSEEIKAAYRTGRYNDVCKALEELTISHASQTYIRLVRTELWRDDPKQRNRRLAVYAVLGHVLRSIDELLHPVSPFVTECLFQEVFADKRWKVPLIVSGFQWTESARGGGQAEGVVDFALRVEEACNSARTRAGLKRRWPLRTLKVVVGKGELQKARSAVGTIRSLCNVKKVLVTPSTTSFPAKIRLVPNSAKIGTQFREKTREVLAAVKPLEGEAAARRYISGRPLRVETKSGKVEVPVGAFELAVEAEEGTVAVEKGGVFVALDRKRDDRLVAEGLVRDIARRLQALRKKRGFVPTAVLAGASVAGLEAGEIDQLETMKKEIAFLVRVREVRLEKERTKGRDWAEEDLDGRPVFLDVG